jgi:hypothetical protein
MKYLTIDSDNKILGWNEDAHTEGCIETDSVIPEYTDTQSLYWEGETVVAKDDDEKITIKAERIATQYARARQSLYPAIGDQLDDLYHKGAFSAEMTATIKKVKDDNPK